MCGGCCNALPASEMGHSRRYCHVRSLVRYPQHRTLRRSTEARPLVAFLRPICKQRAQPSQLLRPDFAQSGDTRRTCGHRGRRATTATILPRNLLLRRLVRIFSDRSLAKGGAGTARSRTPTERLQDKRREVRPGRCVEEGNRIRAPQRGAFLARSLRRAASLCTIMESCTSSAAPSHDRLERAVAGRPQARQGSRCARPAPPACGLDRLAAARLSASKRSWRSSPRRAQNRQCLECPVLYRSGAPYGTRTRVSAVKGRRPGPLDEGRGKAGDV
jgi:hypothetical protein